MSGTTLSIGQYVKFAAAVLKALPRDITPENALLWANNGKKLTNTLASALCPLATPIPSPANIISVDCVQSLEQMIAAGHYNWTNSHIISERFPVTGTGILKLEAKIFYFNRHISSENAVKEIETADPANPWSVAKIEHLLYFGAIYPEEQRKYSIIGLGSVARIDDGDCVPVLYGGGAGRGLSLSRWDGRWDDFSRFLAVRQLPSGTDMS